MLKVSLRSNIRQQLGELTELRREVREKAIVRALNRTADQVKTAASRRIRDTYTITKRDLDGAMVVRKAWRGKLEASIVARGGAIPAYDFRGRWRRTWPGARVTIKKGRTKTIRNTFVARMDSGHVGIFERVPGTKMRNKNKEQIRELFTIGVPGMFGNRQIYAALRAVAGELFDKNLRQQLTFLTRKA